MEKSTASITLLSLWLTMVIYFCFPHTKATGHFEDSEAKAEVNADEQLENKLHALSGDDHDAVAKRAMAAVIGAFVADAATMPLHWLYDTDQIVKLLKKKSKMASPEFYQPPSSPFYKYKHGALSPYGDEALPLLRSLVKHGELDPPALADDLFASFKAYRGRLNHASKGFIRNMENGQRWPHCGVDDDQAHSLVKVAIVVARYAGKPEMLQKMEQAIRVHQDNDLAVEMGLAAAQLLERIVLGSTIAEALEWATSNARGAGARSAIREAVTMRLQPTLDAVSIFGKSCHLPGSFKGPIQCVARSANYTEAVRENILAGGDNCSRAALIGACFAAAYGLDSIPTDWHQAVNQFGEITALAANLVESRTSIFHDSSTSAT